jgi:hypothetical protein
METEHAKNYFAGKEEGETVESTVEQRDKQDRRCIITESYPVCRKHTVTRFRKHQE